MGNMLQTRGTRAFCDYGCCRPYPKVSRQRKKIKGMFRARDKRAWKKDAQNY